LQRRQGVGGRIRACTQGQTRKISTEATPVARSPEEESTRWQPPGLRKDTPPKEVPEAVRRDRRQDPLPLEEGKE
jgi:hypothetical protein